MIFCTASGGRAAIFSASSTAVGSSSSCGTTRLTSPMLVGASGVDHVAGEQQLGGDLPPDELGEPADPGHVGAQAAQHEQLTELGPLGGDADVGHHRQLHPPADGGAVDRGDHRHVAVQHRVGGRRQPRARP